MKEVRLIKKEIEAENRKKRIKFPVEFDLSDLFDFPQLACIEKIFRCIRLFCFEVLNLNTAWPLWPVCKLC